MITETFTSDDARKRWRDLLDMAYADRAEAMIERYNKPVAVLVNYDQYQTIKALLDEIRMIKQAEKNLQAWRKNPLRGKPYTQFRQELIDEGLLVE
jgi:PHD/YefM family antitoxin component YafN of YafNO toxin-antitoxin module